MIAGEVLTKKFGLKDNLINNLISINDTVDFYISEIDKIRTGINSIQSIENQAKLISINATIETEHASSLLLSFKSIVENNLIIQAKMLSRIIELDPGILKGDAVSFCKKCGIEGLTVTDGADNVVFTNSEGWENGSLVSESEIIKSAEIDRTDAPGKIRLKARYIQSRGHVAIFGFGVIAREAKRLADDMNEISRQICITSEELGKKMEQLNELTVRDRLSQDKGGERGAEINSRLGRIENGFTGVMFSISSLKSQLTSLTNIARQLNLLGIRGAIEDAHSSVNKYDYDNLLNRYMVSEAVLTAIFLEKTYRDKQDELLRFIEYVNLDEVWVTDENGVVELTNVPGGIGFAFSNDGQTAPYMRILSNPDLVVTEPPAVRIFDNKPFKFVGVGRRDKGGICQVGRLSKIYGGSEEQGFTVVSNRFKLLAEEYRKNIEEVEAIISDMRDRTQQALRRVVNTKKLI